MVKVCLGMNEKVLDVELNQATLKWCVFKWLDTNYPGCWRMWLSIDGYWINLPSQDSATEFSLTWL